MSQDEKRRQQMKDMLYTTTIMFLPLWMRRIRENFSEILEGEDFLKIPRNPEGSTIIVGGGPSIQKFNLLDRIRDSGYQGTIITTDRSLCRCLKSGVIPDFMCSTDADYRNNFLETIFPWDDLMMHYDKVKALFAVISPANVTRKWIGKKYWFTPVLDAQRDPLGVTQTIHHLTMKTIVDTLANVSGLATVLTLYLGKTVFAYVGLDMSFPEAEKPEDTEYWQDWAKDSRRDTAYQKVYNPLTKTECLTELRLETYCHILKNLLASWRTPLEVWNLSQQGIFFGNKIKWGTVEEFVKQHPR